MNRGDVWMLDLGGRAGRRPALILTRQGVIPHVNKLTVAEITSVGKGYPTEVPIGQSANLARTSYAQVDKLQTVAKARFVNYLGALDASAMRTVGTYPDPGVGSGGSGVVARLVWTLRRETRGAAPCRGGRSSSPARGWP